MIDKVKLNKIADMASISILEKESEKYIKYINSKMKYIEEIQVINTDEVNPLISVLDVVNNTRKDIVKQEISQEELLINNENLEDGMFKIPKVLD